jgi:N-acetylmuramoyl-L-alanine amidase
MAQRLLYLTLFLLYCWPAAAGQVSGFRVWADPDKTRAVLDLSGKSEYRVFTLQNPDRVVIDLDASAVKTRLELNEKHSGVISGVRHGKPDKDTLRVVLDLSERAGLKSFLLEPTGQYGHRLVVDLFGASTHQAKAKPRKVSYKPAANRDIVIAIDAGHGGEDPGAIGSKRTREKTVVLQIARKLKKTIDDQPGMRAVLTRDGDYYIPLRGRYEKARQERADLFVSIHADAFKNPRVSGSSVFVLSNRGASSEFGRLLAQRENASDLVGGVTLNDKDDMLASVLLDLSQSATMEASNAVAEQILGSLKRNVKTHKSVVGHANFLVLKSPDVPSVLVETAFISNPSEEKRLTQRDFQQKMADSIAQGINRYFYNSPPPGTWVAANYKADRHIVARGDTLGGIASHYRVSVASIRRVNNIRGDLIHVGKELVIPTT